MKAFEDLALVVRHALADARLADRIHGDLAFRAALRDDPDATLRAFRVTTLPEGGQRPRQLPRPLRIPVDLARLRPLL